MAETWMSIIKKKDETEGQWKWAIQLGLDLVIL